MRHRDSVCIIIVAHLGMGNYHEIGHVCVCVYVSVCVSVCLSVRGAAPTVFNAASSFSVYMLSIVPSGSLLKMVEIE